MFSQQQDIFSPFPQRRYAEFDGIDAVEQVLPETALGHPLMQVGIGGTDQPHVDGSRLYRPQTYNLLDGCQQFGLHRERKIADFVQKERASRSDFHPSRFGFPGIRKSPLFIAEQFTFEQLFRYASQVDGHESRILPGREILQHPRDEILSRSVFPQYKNICVGI